jgi:hypothetical protein
MTIDEEIVAAEAEEQELYDKWKQAQVTVVPLQEAWSEACQRLTKLRAKAELLAEMKGEK